MKYPGQQNLRFQEKNIQKTIFLEKFLFWDPWVLKFKELSFTPSDDVHTPLECSQRSKQQTSLCYWRNRHVCTVYKSLKVTATCWLASVCAWVCAKCQETIRTGKMKQAVPLWQPFSDPIGMSTFHSQPLRRNGSVFLWVNTKLTELT